jgi:hypothetical protein
VEILAGELVVHLEDDGESGMRILAVLVGCTMIGMDVKFCGLYCGALE